MIKDPMPKSYNPAITNKPIIHLFIKEFFKNRIQDIQGVQDVIQGVIFSHIIIRDVFLHVHKSREIFLQPGKKSFLLIHTEKLSWYVIRHNQVYFSSSNVLTVASHY